jgi:predicted phosphodiesterase
MSRLAVISDVHADLDSLRNALARIERMGCDLIVCAGDIMDGGDSPEETIALLRAHAVPCIRGNHERWAVARGAAEVPRRTRRAPSQKPLSGAALDYLSHLPTQWDGVIDGVRVAVHHGTPQFDMEGIYPSTASANDVHRWLDDAAADVLLVGHTHLRFVLEVADGRLIANPGALQRSPRTPAGRVFDPRRGVFLRDRIPSGGTFGVLEPSTRDFRVFRASNGRELTITHKVV